MSSSDVVIENIPLITSPGQGADVPVHYMPFSIEYSGPSKVSSFFMPETKVKYENSLLNKQLDPPKPLQCETVFRTASFRGREVTGKDVSLTPYESVGIVVTSKEGKNTRHEVTSAFNELTVWHPDQLEVQVDCVTKALKYTKYLEILHSDD